MAAACARNFAVKCAKLLEQPRIYSFSLGCSQERSVSYKLHQGSKTKRKPPAVRIVDGEFVRKGDILVVQATLLFLPGLNVDITPTRELQALADGLVVITAEKSNPRSDHVLASGNYHLPSCRETYKKYFNVIPFQQSMKFSLIDLV